MDFVKAHLDRIQQQLKGLTASQKMLTGALVAIMVLTLMMWGRYAGTAEMEPLLNQSLSDDDVSRIIAELDAHHIDHKMEGNRILVPADQKVESLAHVGFAGALPRNFSSGFDDVVKQISPFAPEKTTDEMFKKGKENALATIISNFPQVKQAVVMIGANTRRQIGHGGDVEASATITIFMKAGNPASQQLVNAAADVVCGAQSNLQRARVKVNVDGIPRKVSGSDDGTGIGGPDASDRLAVQQAAEKRLEDKIANQFSYIPGLMVSVSVDLNSKTVKSEVKTYDADKSLHKPIEENERTEESTPALPQVGGEAGAAPNVGMSLAQGSGGGGEGGSSSVNESKTKYQLLPGSKQDTILMPAGDVTPVAASVRVPRSYFINVLRGGRTDAKDPDTKAVDALIAEELPNIRNDVKQIAKLKNDADVSVATYLDAAPMIAGGAPVASTASSMSVMLGGHSKEIIIGALAVVSLFMVSMMVRRGAPVAAATALAEPAAPPAVLGGGELIAGEATGDGAGALDAMELDDDAIRTQQVLEQVGSMVGDDPDAAASLVKRWLNRA